VFFVSVCLCVMSVCGEICIRVVCADTDVSVCAQVD